ncbi:hypothetical protein [Flavobacterium sp. UBA6135]|uniref:hypothetical protein n=1 Tax=Flavobacterium sp. UBA6135 TaxID=1946553 RepID=UPI0025BA7312|nr:hypothetical protein [Flavobacterium sp. UBA6135]
MKNLFFTLAFMLIGTFAFANSLEIENYSNENQLNLSQSYLVEDTRCTSWTTFVSCGFTWYSCNSSFASIEEQWEFVEYIHGLHCN